MVWDDRYQHEYAATMIALAEHLKRMKLPGAREGSAFDSLVAVKLSGINVGTEELRLDEHKATPELKACPEPDVTALWKERGFRPQLILKAWTEIASMTANTFPGKVLSMDIIPNNPFPDIDEHGSIYPPTNPPGKKHSVEPLLGQILQVGIATYGKRLLVQWDALSQDGILPVEVTETGKRGALIGYQMNDFVKGNFGGSGCIYNPGFQVGQCRNLDDFAQALLAGIHSGAKYIEVAPQDVAVRYLNPPNPNIKNFAPAFERARQAIFQ